MHWTRCVGWAAAAATVGIDTVVAQTTVVTDRDTGFKFSAYSGRYDLSPSTIQYRVAVPSNAGSGQAYDAVVQIIAPHEIGWAGLAWGGTMTYNPLTVAYPNGQSVVVSSRWATQHAAPGMYPGASYQILPKGTHVNRTHWQVTAKCSGCTAFRGEGGTTSYLRPQSSNRLAFALARQGPSPPITNTSAIMYHDVHQYWSHDFGSGGNTNFAALLQQNLG